MSIPETVLIFVGCPAGIIAVVTALVVGPSEIRKPSRYRPGKPWTHAPAWYLPHEIGGSSPSGHSDAPALTGAGKDTTAFGGATGEW